MRILTLLMATAISSGTFVQATPSEAQTSSGKVTVCHRTGNKAVAGRFMGHTITIEAGSVAGHVSSHGDVVVKDSAKQFFVSKRDCAIDAQGNLFDSRGVNVQPVLVPLPPPPPPPPPLPPVLDLPPGTEDPDPIPG